MEQVLRGGVASSITTARANRHNIEHKKLNTALERPTGAPPVDYGGKHPFENHSRYLQQDFSSMDASNTDSFNNGTSFNGHAGDDGPYEPIRIDFDVSLVVESVYADDPSVALLYDQLIDVATFWKERLSVVPIVGSLVPIGGYISGRCPTGKTVENADLLIFVTANKYCSASADGFDKLASAISCERDQFDRPVTGTIDFCLSGISKNDNEKIKGVAIHEIGHILGMSSNSLPFFRNPRTGEPLTKRPFVPKKVKCVNGEEYFYNIVPDENTVKGMQGKNGVRHFLMVTPMVKTVVRNHFDCQSLEGARLENQPTGNNDCYGSHWDERLFYSESMSAVYNDGSSLVSPLTLAFLEDTGWYRADYSKADMSPFGHGAGCDFVNSDCIVNGEIPYYSRGNFCNSINKESMCDPTYRRKAFCDLVDISTVDNLDPAPSHFQYFGNPELRPQYFTRADFCPLPNVNELWCADPSRYGYKSSLSSLGEIFSADSRCFETDSTFSLCLESVCNYDTNTLEVFFGDISVTCDHDFEVKSIPTSNIKITCPRLSQACPDMFCPADCAGRGICDYNASAICIEGTCRYKASCSCFDKNDTTSFCSETDILETKLSDDSETSTLYAVVLIGGAVVGLVVLFFAWKWKKEKDRE